MKRLAQWAAHISAVTTVLLITKTFNSQILRQKAIDKYSINNNNNNNTYKEREREREREREERERRERERERERQTGQTGQTDRQTETDRQTDRQTETERDRDRETETERQREIDRQTGRQADRQTARQRQYRYCEIYLLRAASSSSFRHAIIHESVYPSRDSYDQIYFRGDQKKTRLRSAGTADFRCPQECGSSPPIRRPSCQPPWYGWFSVTTMMCVCVEGGGGGGPEVSVSTSDREMPQRYAESATDRRTFDVSEVSCSFSVTKLKNRSNQNV